MSEINERIFKLRTCCIEERLSVTVSVFSITLFLLLLSSYQSRALDHTKCLSQFLMKKKKMSFVDFIGQKFTKWFFEFKVILPCIGSLPFHLLMSYNNISYFMVCNYFFRAVKYANFLTIMFL